MSMRDNASKKVIKFILQRLFMNTQFYDSMRDLCLYELCCSEKVLRFDQVFRKFK